MRLLLDTQVAILWLTASLRLSKTRAANGRLALGIGCGIWEVDLKHRLGKLPIARGAFATRCVGQEQRHFQYLTPRLDRS